MKEKYEDILKEAKALFKEKYEDILKEAKALFKASSEAEADNREQLLDDLKFARLREQWHPADRKQRELEDRPVDSEGDIKTAEIYDSLIKNIQASSNASIAYDTCLNNAVTMGIGYWRVNLDYAHDDTFDMNIKIERIGNP